MNHFLLLVLHIGRAWKGMQRLQNKRKTRREFLQNTLVAGAANAAGTSQRGEAEFE